MTDTIFFISLTSGVSIFILSLFQSFYKELQFWPPPTSKSWQHRLFLFLFRIMFYSLIALSVLDYNANEYINEELRFFIGLPLLLIGFGMAFYLTYYLGWRNAFGEKRGLITSGIYSYSRNPVYVVSIIGMIGWCVFASSLQVGTILLLWSVMYVLAPLIEEPWLEKAYGEEYLSYKTRVPRYFGVPNKT